MTTLPDALLLMGRHCPYCPTVLKHLQALQTEGTIGKLETVVLEENPERAAELGVRSVPWVRIGPFELVGLRSLQELREWAQQSNSTAGMSRYLEELLNTGNIAACLSLIQKDPETLRALLSLFADPDTELNTRIGISAIMETLEGNGILLNVLDELVTLTGHSEPGIRADACHFLALTGDQKAKAAIRQLQDDPDPNVRELANELYPALDS